MTIETTEGDLMRAIWEQPPEPCAACYGTRRVPKQAYTANGERIPFAVLEGDYVEDGPCPNCT